MLYKIRWLWKQFTGPIITAIYVGIWRVVSAIDSTISYINALSIDTCNSSHATLLSLAMGIPRPFISLAPEGFMFFTSHYTEGESYGFSDKENPSIGGGYFADLYDPATMPGTYLAPIAIWRIIMQATRDTTAEPGSIVWIDEVLKALTVSGAAPYSAYSWYTSNDLVHAIGDLKIYMGNNEIYGSAYTTDTLTLQELFSELLNPDKKVEVINAAKGTEETWFIGGLREWAYGAMSPYLGQLSGNKYGFWEAITCIQAIPSQLDALFATKTINVTSSRLDLRNSESMVLCTWETKNVENILVTEGELFQVTGEDGVITIGEELTFDSETLYAEGSIHLTAKIITDITSKAPTGTNTLWGICFVIPGTYTIPSNLLTGLELYWDAELQATYLRALGRTAPIYSISYRIPEVSNG